MPLMDNIPDMIGQLISSEEKMIWNSNNIQEFSSRNKIKTMTHFLKHY